jgi:signal transduction histidine kinase/ligand-binding sensor domain-containing protein
MRPFSSLQFFIQQMKPTPAIHIFILILLAIPILISCQSTGISSEAVSSPEFTIASESPPTYLSNRHLPPPSLRFERISTQDGLSNSIVTCILQDINGYMWFGTQDGLNQYDGYEFKVFRHDPDDPESLEDDFIESIFEDRDGTLWVGTQDGWLEKFDAEKQTFTHYDLGARVLAIFEDSSSRFWIGTLEPGLVLFDRDSGTPSMIWDEREVSSIIEDLDGNVWVVSAEAGLGKFDEINEKIVPVDLEYDFRNAIVDHQGNIWLASLGGGLGLFDPGTQSAEYFQNAPTEIDSISTNNLRLIYEDQSGNLWIGTYEYGLDHFDLQTKQFVHYQNDPGNLNSLSSNSVMSICEDRSGVMWIGTGVGGGVNKLSPDIERFGHYKPIPNNPKSLSGNLVTSISSDQRGIIWLGTNNGLDRWNPETGEWRNYQNEPDNPSSLSDNMIRSVYVDQANTLWIGTENGLDRYDPETDGFIYYPDSPVVMWMHESKSGNMWLATKSGFFEYDREANQLNLIKEGFSWKIMVYEDSNEIVWVGSSGDGLDRYDPDIDQWQHYEHDPDDPTSLSNNFVEAIHGDKSGVLWFATGGGLNRLNPKNQTFSYYTVNDGLPHDYVNGILEDDQGNLWLTTLGGLSKFDLRLETFTNFDVNDGLQSNFFWRNAYHLTAAGDFIFGGENGFNIFHPDQIINNAHIPPVYITKLSLFNETFQTDLLPGDQIELNYQENFLSFDFVALDYNNPEKNQFAYRMDGVDDDWVMAGTRRHADYPNLKPGVYVFRVMGSNDDGFWNPSETTLHIRINPPFWGTLWFQGLVGIMLVSSLYGILRLRVRNLENRSQELEAQVLERTAELENANEQLAQERAEAAVAEERTRLARELHDAVTQTLFSASLLAEALPNYWETDPEKSRQLLREIRQLSRGALAEMRTLLHELRPATIAETALSELLRQLAESVTGREGIPVDVHVNCQCDLPDDLHVALYRITQESLNNVVKHARATEVSIKLECSKCATGLGDSILARVISLSVEDDGRGFDLEKHTEDGMGVGIMRERAESVSAVLLISSQHGEGTRVEVVWEDGGSR